MPITERTLRKWRKEALKALHGEFPEGASVILFEEFCERILRMTQVLLDQHLVRKETR